MSRKRIVILGYALIFFSIPFLRDAFLRSEAFVIFWVLVLEHLVMIPLSVRGFASPDKNGQSLMATGSALVLAAGLLFVIFLCTVDGISDRGMGIIIFLLFPAVEGLVALVGGVMLMAGLFRTHKKKGDMVERS